MQLDATAFAAALGSRLQKRRQSKALTLEQVVAQAGLSVSKSSLSAIENGNQDISVLDLYQLSRLLGFNAGDLIDEVVRELLGEKFSSINLDR